MAKGDIPPKNSAQWKRNESIIAKTPMLRAARDQAEGFNPNAGSSGTGGWTPSQAYKDNYDLIFGKKDRDNE